MDHATGATVGNQVALTAVCLVIWSVWSIWLVSFNQTHESDRIDQTNQTDQMNKTGWRTFSASRHNCLEPYLNIAYPKQFQDL